MNLRGTIVLGATLVAAAGCATEEPAPPASEDAANTAPAPIRAVRPKPMKQRASRRPRFRWRLPKRLQKAVRVTFLLAEAGSGAEPVTDASRQRRIATATGLDPSGTEALDLWDPPAGCVLTGEVTDMPQLAPATWYRWRLRAIGPGTAEHADFYFRTRQTSAVPGE